MLRKLIAAGALAGTLVVGSAGIAGAATSNTTGATTATPKACAKAPKVLARLEKANAKYQAWLSKAETREQKAKAAHKTVVADRIAVRIARAQLAYQRGSNLYHRIEAKCPGATASGSTATPGTTTATGTTGG